MVLIMGLTFITMTDVVSYARYRIIAGWIIIGLFCFTGFLNWVVLIVTVFKEVKTRIKKYILVKRMTK